MATIGFKTDKLSETVKRALKRAPNKSDYIRRALEHYEDRNEYKEILHQLAELREVINGLTTQKAGVLIAPSLDTGKKKKAEEDLLAGLAVF